MLFFSQIFSVQRCILILVILGFVFAVTEEKPSVRKIPQVVKSWVVMPFRMVKSWLTKLSGMIVRPKAVRVWKNLLESTVKKLNNDKWSNENKDVLKRLVETQILLNVGLNSLEKLTTLRKGLLTVNDDSVSVEELLLKHMFFLSIVVLILSRSTKDDLTLIDDTLSEIRGALDWGKKVADLDDFKSSKEGKHLDNVLGDTRSKIDKWREGIKNSDETKKRARFRFFRASTIQEKIDKDLGKTIRLLCRDVAIQLRTHHEPNGGIDQYTQVLSSYGKDKPIFLGLGTLYDHVIEEYIGQYSSPDTLKVLGDDVNERIWNHIVTTVVPPLLSELKRSDNPNKS